LSSIFFFTEILSSILKFDFHEDFINFLVEAKCYFCESLGLLKIMSMWLSIRRPNYAIMNSHYYLKLSLHFKFYKPIRFIGNCILNQKENQVDKFVIICRIHNTFFVFDHFAEIIFKYITLISKNCLRLFLLYKIHKTLIIN